MDHTLLNYPNEVAHRICEAQLQLLSQPHDAFLTELMLLAGLPSLFAQLQQAQCVAASALAKIEDEMLPHHATEEKVLFAAVLLGVRNDAEREQVQSLTLQLAAEHRNVEQLWARVAPGLRALAEVPVVQIDEALLTRLLRDYSRHVLLEESEFLPLARNILADSPSGLPTPTTSNLLRPRSETTALPGDQHEQVL
ncbi:hemerythrin domain-containing protein [Ramlibacter sp. WS9]|uniref:hemerythrin domain-containing protein n=1 Tax=Ramlibacter sp. WS9 TaxID=1882741 RepID=UPI0011446E7E|nr:hemerythrin domain-containing protein [Ramlibacter sp. WS9]ROZ79164.1 hemerythrin domain-containing protein [Ramlibacter sp. WS9]